MTKLEEIARSIYAKINYNPYKDWDLYLDSHGKYYIAGHYPPEIEAAYSAARAAVEAMREPGESILDAGRHANRLTPTNALGLVYVPPDAAWAAMIDAILSEDDGGKTG